MNITKFNNMKHGWFIGNFEPSAFKTNFEVAYRICQAGDHVDIHYHKLGTEINLLVEGIMIINNTILNSGDIFTIYPYEVVHVKYLTECKLVIVKNISCNADKFKVIGERNENF